MRDLVCRLRPMTPLALVLAAQACSMDGIGGIERPTSIHGSGVAVEEVRAFRGASGLILDAPGTAHVTLGDSESIRLEIEENLLPHIELYVEGGRLRIGVDPRVRLRPTVPIRYHVTMRELGRVTAAGEGRVEAGGLRGDQLLVSSSGSGGVRLTDVRVSRLSLAVTGSGAVHAAGRVPLLDVSLAASGPFHGRELDADEAVASVAGSGSATLQVRRRLDANVSGSGSVLYYGTPDVTASVSGSGEVRQAGR
jgi:hypothetical protein